MGRETKKKKQTERDGNREGALVESEGVESR